MPAINVARTDTFETQRQKINQIGNQIFNISQGGSDLATGNLKLGDGTRTAPSLAFTSDSTLGIYKSNISSIGYVYNQKKIIDIGNENIVTYRDFYSQKRFLESSGILVTSTGFGYDPGSYTDIALVGGSGEKGTANITVSAFNGSITSNGENYLDGSYNSIELQGGSGTGAIANFFVDGIIGDIASEGSGYFPGSYFSVPVTGGSGTNAKADIFINDPAGQVSSITGSVTTPGSGYADSSYNNISIYNTPTSTYTVVSIPNPGTPPPSSVYTIDGNTQQVLSLSKGNTYRFDVSDSSLATHPLIFENTDGSSLLSVFYVVVPHGTIGTPGAFIDLIIKPGAPTETIRYNCSVHNGMGADINVSSGTIGQYGSGAFANIDVSGGLVSNVSFSNIGYGYKSSDVLEVASSDLGGGSGFEYTVNSVSLYGQVGSFFVVETGQNYVNGDSISFDPINVGNSGSGFQLDITSFPGTIQTIQFLDKGSGYLENDVLTLPTPINGISTNLDSAVNTIAVPSVSGIYPGFIVEQISGSGDLGTNVSVIIADSQTNLVTLSSNPITTGSAVVNFVPPYGVPTTDFEFTIVDIGTVDTVTISDGGNGYFEGDNLTVNPTDLTAPLRINVTIPNVQKLTFVQTIPGSVFGPTDTLSWDDGSIVNNVDIYEIKLDISGNVEYLITEDLQIPSGDQISKTGDPTLYDIDTASTTERYFFDDGSGPQAFPDVTFYSGNTYIFDFSDPSNGTHLLSLSQNPDGTHYSVLGLTSNLSNSTKTITVSSTTGLYPGMEVNSGLNSVGLVDTQTYIVSIDDATTLTLNKVPVADGLSNLEFYGTEYTESVVRSGAELSIKITDNTPNLYYYCAVDPNAGGDDSNESVISIDLNNPKTFGSGLVINVFQVSSEDVISIVNDTGNVICKSIQSTSSAFNTLDVSSNITSPTASIETLNVNNITSTGSTIFIGPQLASFSGNVEFGSTVNIDSGSGQIVTSGVLRTNNSLNVNNKLIIADNNITTTTGNDILLTPPFSRITKISSSSALIIPSGSDAERPTTPLAQNGAIRFNTTTNQYEGYSSTNSSWSSLGGVRDIDGNTYILAELTAGANDNNLWFFNDNINTLKLSNQFLDFRSVKKISSGKLGLPSFTLWTANTPVNIGQYLKFRNNLYEVTASGTTATSGSEPTHTSGVANNGTAQLTWYSSAVSPLEFTEVEELRVGPNKDCPLIVNSETKVFNNTISTLVEDLVLAPNSGKKVTIACSTSLVIPVGNTNQRESASQGSIRYNTTISQFEGYSGNNWSSLGGVRDVDGNTYIIPETAPAANENILYFYNDGTNTLQVTTTELDFTNLDTITTSGGNSLAINTNIVTLDNSATTIDNTGSTSTFISTTKQYLDLGLSTGLTVDPVLRLDDQGDVYLNTGFGTGSFNGVKIFDGDLKDFELADYLVKTSVLSLQKGLSNSGAVILYDTATAKGCRVTVVSKSSVGKKSMVEYNVIDNGTDVFHNEFGSLNTSADGFTALFDITPGNETRITLTLSDDHATNDTVEITVLTQVVK